MKKLKVLLVDDEMMIREGFKRLFDWKAHDCEIVGEAADGMEALAKIDTLEPDIVIMDINIPIISGLKVIEISRKKHPEIACVIVSGYDDFSYCQQALRLQITDYILKPVNYEEFGSCIDNLKISMYEQKVVSAQEPKEQEERDKSERSDRGRMNAHRLPLKTIDSGFFLSFAEISVFFKKQMSSIPG